MTDRFPAQERNLASRVLAWYPRHGRTDLPWQKDATPYRVWVSEIMLQQTQVLTVIPYYEAFVTRFPTLEHLAEAPLDDVLHLWSGLGYYARARNLHRAACILRDEHGGRFPRLFDAVSALPGVGRSTAGAILSLSCGQRHPILDGNVKRVLSRHFAVEGWPGRSSVLKILWEIAEKLTPRRKAGTYNQAMMDLGSLVCTRAAPACDRCPLAASCVARAQGRQRDFPGPRPRRRQPVRKVQMLLIENGEGQVLLEQRPPQGVWGGLWSFPELPVGDDPENWCAEWLGGSASVVARLEERKHVFSHFVLDIRPVHLSVKNPDDRIMEADRWVWYKPDRSEARGLAAPVARLLEELTTTESEGETA